MKPFNMVRSLFAVSATLSLVACGSGRELSITKMKPPTKEAAGTGLTAASTLLASSKGEVGIFGLADNVQTRFFAAGPTDIMTILGSLDTRLAEIETRAAEDDHTCLDATASSVAISILGETVNAKFQCYDDIGTGFIAFGKDGDTWWVLDAVGASNTLAKATTSANGTDVEIWGTVGIGNTPNWDSMSYGAYHLKGNSSTKVFEMTAGGIGFGFCGISLKSDGTNLYVEGSADGAGTACSANANACVLTSSVSSGNTGCSAAGLNTSSFALNKVGRASVASSWNASTWPSSGQLTMDGSASDAIHWASKAAVTGAGVAKF